MSLDFSFANRNHIAQDFYQWIVNENPSHCNDPLIEDIRNELSVFEKTLDEIEKGIYVPAKSRRLIKTVKSIAEKILKNCPEKVKKIDHFQVCYAYSTGCYTDKENNLFLRLDPRKIIEMMPDSVRKNMPDFSQSINLHKWDRVLDDCLLKDPTLLNTLVAHEIVHYKYDDGPMGVLRNSQWRFEYWQKKQIKAFNIKEYEKTLLLNEARISRELEARADCEAYQAFGCARKTMEYFEKNSKEDIDLYSTHPSSLARAEIAKKFLNVPDQIPSIHFSFFEQIAELTGRLNPIIGIL